MNFPSILGSLSLSLLLAACGGGGGDAPPSVPGPIEIPEPIDTPDPIDTPQPVETDAGSADSPQFAIDASGNVTVVWSESDGTRSNIWANRFSAASGSWGTAQLIETDNAGTASLPRFAIDASGNVIAVWNQSDGTRSNVWANRFSAASDTWGTAQLIETDDAGDAFLHRIAIDGSGNGIAVLSQAGNLLANRFSAASGVWGTAQLIETDNAGAVSGTLAEIAIDASDNVIAVWRQSDGTRLNLWANRFSAASGTWGMAQLIETENAANALTPQIAIDASGNVIAVWSQSGIWANRFSAASGTWGTARLIASGASPSRFVMDASGNAIVFWSQFDGTQSNIWASRFSAAVGTWGAAQLIAGNASSPQIVIDASGNVIAVWRQPGGTGFDLWANRFSAASGTWGTAQLIETNAESVESPQIAIDAGGNVIAVWRQSDGTRFNLWANRFSAASGTWGTTQLIETDNGGNASIPQIAIDASGNVIAVWQQPRSNPSLSFDIWANRFSAASGTWGAAQVIQADARARFQRFSVLNFTTTLPDPRIAVGASGNAVAIWRDFDGTRFSIWANSFSAATGTWGVGQVIQAR